MRKIRVYFQESFNELIHKVTWPTWKELQNSAVVVMIATGIISIIIWIMDYGFQNALGLIYGSFGG